MDQGSCRSPAAAGCPDCQPRGARQLGRAAVRLWPHRAKMLVVPLCPYASLHLVGNCQLTAGALLPLLPHLMCRSMLRRSATTAPGMRWVPARLLCSLVLAACSQASPHQLLGLRCGPSTHRLCAPLTPPCPALVHATGQPLGGVLEAAMRGWIYIPAPLPQRAAPGAECRQSPALSFWLAGQLVSKPVCDFLPCSLLFPCARCYTRLQGRRSKLKSRWW